MVDRPPHEDAKHGKEATFPSPVPGGSESVESLGALVDRLLGDRRVRKDAAASVSESVIEADEQGDSDSPGGHDAPSPSAPPPPVPGGNESVTKGKDPPGRSAKGSLSDSRTVRTLSRGGPDRNRTDDLIHAMDALYQLSYGPGAFDANKKHP
jgi:hypothetical protein